MRATPSGAKRQAVEASHRPFRNRSGSPSAERDKRGKGKRATLGVLVVVIATVMTAVLPAAAPAAPARSSAAVGYVYLVTPKWWGWCPYSSITYVGWFNAGVSQGGDGGNDIVYAKVLLKQDNRITMQVSCSRSMPMGNVVTTIRPNRNGQTFWFGYPAGVWSN